MSEPIQWRAASRNGFVAACVAYCSSGYWYVWQGRVRPPKDAKEVASRLIAEYEMPTKTWELKRRNRQGRPAIRLLQLEQTLVVFLTSIEHPFCENRPGLIDVRRKPLIAFGYQIKAVRPPDGRGTRIQVRLSPKRYSDIRSRLCEIATQDRFRDRSNLEAYFKSLDVQPYGHVFDQMESILKCVNRERKRANFEPVHPSCLRRFRTVSSYYE